MYEDEEEVLDESPDLEDEELEDLPEELKEGDDDELFDPDSKYH